MGVAAHFGSAVFHSSKTVPLRGKSCRILELREALFLLIVLIVCSLELQGSRMLNDAASLKSNETTHVRLTLASFFIVAEISQPIIGLSLPQNVYLPLSLASLKLTDP